MEDTSPGARHNLLPLQEYDILRLETTQGILLLLQDSRCTRSKVVFLRSNTVLSIRQEAPTEAPGSRGDISSDFPPVRLCWSRLMTISYHLVTYNVMAPKAFLYSYHTYILKNFSKSETYTSCSSSSNPKIYKSNLANATDLMCIIMYKSHVLHRKCRKIYTPHSKRKGSYIVDY